MGGGTKIRFPTITSGNITLMIIFIHQETSWCITWNPGYNKKNYKPFHSSQFPTVAPARRVAASPVTSAASDLSLLTPSAATPPLLQPHTLSSLHFTMPKALLLLSDYLDPALHLLNLNHSLDRERGLGAKGGGETKGLRGFRKTLQVTGLTGNKNSIYLASKSKSTLRNAQSFLCTQKQNCLSVKTFNRQTSL